MDIRSGPCNFHLACRFFFFVLVVPKIESKDRGSRFNALNLDFGRHLIYLSCFPLLLLCSWTSRDRYFLPSS